MKLKTVRKFVFAMLGAALVLVFIGEVTDGVISIVFAGLSLVPILAACVVSLRFRRCPHCNGSLRLFPGGKYCPHCGKKLEEL